jgi:hypothetical protein
MNTVLRDLLSVLGSKMMHPATWEAFYSEHLRQALCEMHYTDMKKRSAQLALLEALPEDVGDLMLIGNRSSIHTRLFLGSTSEKTVFSKRQGKRKVKVITDLTLACFEPRHQHLMEVYFQSVNGILDWDPLLCT